ncbi:hypothetical protein BFP75_05305 [Maribacter sp. 4G9]|nr:hypothetical protein BFP75_05305 [Maribacter sp. 4G9]
MPRWPKKPDGVTKKATQQVAFGVEPEGPELTFQTAIKMGCSAILKIYAHRIGNYFQKKQVRFLKYLQIGANFRSVMFG